MNHLTILQINDLHGYLAPHPELFDLAHGHDFRSGGGLARVATICRTVRREVGGAAIALDNGDTFHGTMPAVQTRGDALIGPMRALGLDGMTVHWEFAYGLERVREIAERLPATHLLPLEDRRGVSSRPTTTLARARSRFTHSPSSNAVASESA